MQLVKMAIEKKLADEGIDWAKIDALQIDSKAKQIAVTVSLEGETSPIDVAVAYRLDGNDLVVDDVSASRPWLAKAVKLFLEKRGDRFALPGGMKGAAVRLVL